MAAVMRHIQSDLRRILTGVQGIPEIAWEGRKYEISQQTPYISEKLAPVWSGPTTLGDAGYTREEWMYMLAVHGPVDGSLFDLYDACDAIRSHFPAGGAAGSMYPDMYGRVRKADIRPLVVDKDWNTLPVHIFGFTHRRTRP